MRGTSRKISAIFDIWSNPLPRIQRVAIDIWVQVLRVAKSSGGETGDSWRREGARIGLIDFPCFPSLSPGCMKHLILNDESHADRKDPLVF